MPRKSGLFGNSGLAAARSFEYTNHQSQPKLPNCFHLQLTTETYANRAQKSRPQTPPVSHLPNPPRDLGWGCGALGVCKKTRKAANGANGADRAAAICGIQPDQSAKKQLYRKSRQPEYDGKPFWCTRGTRRYYMCFVVKLHCEIALLRC